MNPRWTHVTLGEEVKLLSGGTPKKSQTGYWDGDIPWVSSGEMVQRRISDTHLRVTDEGAENGTRLIPEKTVLTVVRGMSLAKEFRVAITQREMTFNQDLKALVPSDKLDSEFLFYYLLSQNDAIRDSATEASHGTKKLETRVLQDWPLPLPCHDEQARIVSALSAYDDLIENNMRRIKLLEESARLLYREWFVRLRFPGHEHTRIVNGVPEGWEPSKIGDLLLKFRRKKKIKKDDFLEEGEIPCVDQSVSFIGGYTDDAESCHTEPLPLVVFGDHTRILKFVNFPFASGADGTQLLYPNKAGISVEWFYFALQSVDLSNYFYARHFKFLKAEELLIPPPLLVNQFTTFARPNLAMIERLRMQNDSLSKARDLLLPKLMSGEIAA